MLFTKEVGIDLGTANTLIYVKGEGIVLNEPSVVSLDAETKKCLAVGQDAKEMLGRTPGRVSAIRPLKDGVIADFEVTELMLEHFIRKLKLKGMFSRPTILICCPSNITSVERNAIRDAAYRCGAKRVYIEEEPKVAAIGAGLDIAKPTGSMVLDIGGGTTDVAILSLGEIVTSTSLKIAGDKLDRDLIKYVKESYKLLIGDRTAEEIKKRIGTAWRGSRSDSMDVSGRDLVTGLPHTITLNSEETELAMRESLQDVVRACRTVLEQTPPELSADIVSRGVVLNGGGALLLSGMAGATGYEGIGGFPDSFTAFANLTLAGLPLPLVLFAIITFFFWLLTHRGRFGRHLFLLGQNPRAARYAALSVNGIPYVLYGLVGVASAVAALVMVSYFGSARSDLGRDLLMPALTAAVLGGANIYGGSGSILGTALAALLVGYLQQGLQMVGIPNQVSSALSGALLVVVVMGRSLSLHREWVRATWRRLFSHKTIGA